MFCKKGIYANVFSQVTPFGFRKVLNWLKQKYNNQNIFITEVGFSGNGTLNDYARVNYTRVSIFLFTEKVI